MSQLTGYRLIGKLDDKRNLAEVGGVWRFRPNGLRIPEISIAAAQTNGADDDEIHLYPGTYNLLTTGLSVTKRLHFIGEGDPRSIIVTGSGDYTFSVTVASCTFRNLTILNTAGGGTDRDVVQWNVDNVVFENCILTKTGAADDSTCFLQYGGTGAQIINCEATTTGATKNYGYWNNTATATCEIRGGKLSGSTWDIIGDQAASVLTLIDSILVNASKSFTGTIRGEAFDQYGRRLRVKPAGINNVRLTLTTGTPVTSSDVTGATTVYAAPYQGSEIEVYNSSFWIEAPFAEISVAVPSTIYRLFDVFVYDNAGTLTLETVNWNQTTGAITGATNATPIVITHNGHGYSNGDIVIVTGVVGNTNANGVWTISGVAANTYQLVGSTGNAAYTSGGTDYKMNGGRATALTFQNGRYAKSGDTTRLYLGTGCTTVTSGQCEGSVSKRFLWNYYNRVEFETLKTDSTSHTYNGTRERYWNEVTTNRTELIIGVQEDRGIIVYSSQFIPAATAIGGIGIGFNSVSFNITPSGYILYGANAYLTAPATAFRLPALGYNFVAAVQRTNNGVNITYDNFSLGVKWLM